MPDRIDFKMVTKDFDFGIARRRALMPRAAMFAVREAGRAAKKAARQQAPVLGDKTRASHSTLQRYARRGFDVSGVYKSRPVPGLLRASISPSKNLKRLGDSEFSMKVGPRGERTHLYAQKIEERAHYMAAGEQAAEKKLADVAEVAFNRVWKG